MARPLPGAFLIPPAPLVVADLKTMRTHQGEDGHNADCLKSKTESPINGGVAYLFGGKIWISVNDLKLCVNFDTGMIHISCFFDLPKI